MDALLLAWIVAASVVALASTAGCGWLMGRKLRGTAHPADGLGFSSFAGFGMLSLLALATGLGRVGEAWAFVVLIQVNLILQPFCGYLFAAGAYKLVMASAGRVTYAWQVLPPGNCTQDQYRALKWYCASLGFLGCSFAAGLGWLCVRPLL